VERTIEADLPAYQDQTARRRSPGGQDHQRGGVPQPGRDSIDLLEVTRGVHTGKGNGRHQATGARNYAMFCWRFIHADDKQRPDPHWEIRRAHRPWAFLFNVGTPRA